MAVPRSHKFNFISEMLYSSALSLASFEASPKKKERNNRYRLDAAPRSTIKGIARIAAQLSLLLMRRPGTERSPTHHDDSPPQGFDAMSALFAGLGPDATCESR